MSSVSIKWLRPCQVEANAQTETISSAGVVDKQASKRTGKQKDKWHGIQ